MNKESLQKAFFVMKQMKVSNIDFQIRSLNSIKLFIAFLRMLAVVLESRQDFELVQSYLTTFLNIHREKLWNVNDGGIKMETDLWGDDEEEKEIQEGIQDVQKNEQKELTLVSF